jgi:hypothetical protein
LNVRTKGNRINLHAAIRSFKNLNGAAQELLKASSRAWTVILAIPGIIKEVRHPSLNSPVSLQGTCCGAKKILMVVLLSRKKQCPDLIFIFIPPR